MFPVGIALEGTPPVPNYMIKLSRHLKAYPDARQWRNLTFQLYIGGYRHLPVDIDFVMHAYVETHLLRNIHGIGLDNISADQFYYVMIGEIMLHFKISRPFYCQRVEPTSMPLRSIALSPTTSVIVSWSSVEARDGPPCENCDAIYLIGKQLLQHIGKLEENYGSLMLNYHSITIFLFIAISIPEG
jgi:hypothetical protein